MAFLKKDKLKEHPSLELLSEVEVDLDSVFERDSTRSSGHQEREEEERPPSKATLFRLVSEILCLGFCR